MAIGVVALAALREVVFMATSPKLAFPLRADLAAALRFHELSGLRCWFCCSSQPHSLRPMVSGKLLRAAGVQIHAALKPGAAVVGLTSSPRMCRRMSWRQWTLPISFVLRCEGIGVITNVGPGDGRTSGAEALVLRELQ
jgi:hypothetical protein